MSPSAAWARVSGYFDSADPRMGFGNTVALIVFGNQPFYPFYVWFVAGAPVAASWLTWLSTPFFVLAPLVARRRLRAGRVLLTGAALVNTVLSAAALGSASGVELFYAPCLMLAWFVAPPSGRTVLVGASAAVVALGLIAVRLVGRPLAGLSDTQLHSLWSMHAISVVCLLAAMAVMAFRLPREADATPRVAR